MSLVSRRGFLAAAVPVVAVGQSVTSGNTPPHYLVALTGPSKKRPRGGFRIAHTSPHKGRAEQLAAYHNKRGRGAIVVAVAKGGAL